MTKPVCLVTAPVATRSGYGAHARDIVIALIKLDKYDIKIWSVKWGSTPLNALEKGNPNDDMIIEVYSNKITIYLGYLSNTSPSASFRGPK